jgi:hypothetical protein
VLSFFSSEIKLSLARPSKVHQHRSEAVWTMKIVTHNFLCEEATAGKLELLLYYFSKEAHA